MIRYGLALLLSLFFTSVIMSTPVLAQDRDGIEETISGQMQAFVSRDVETAFSFASPTIQRLFGTAENFGAMVERGYPMVWDNSNLQFNGLRDEPSGLWQRIVVRDPGGAGHLLDYKMVDGEDGWRIDAVVYVSAADLGV